MRPLIDPPISWPGDEDLIHDTAGVTITAVVVVGDEVWIHATGGVGWWEGDDGERVYLDRVDDIDIRVGFKDVTAGAVRWLIDQLNDWRDRGTGVRITMAPDRLGRIGESETVWIPFPHLPNPEWPA